MDTFFKTTKNFICHILTQSSQKNIQIISFYFRSWLQETAMPWGVYQEYLSARAQGTFRAGPRKWKGVENRLHRKLYQSFGLANQVK